LPSPFRGAPVTVGASAAIFGLLGALVYYGRRTGSSHVHGQALNYALIMGVMGLILPGIDNYAHLGGFGGGYLVGRLLDPLKPEQVNHIAVGVLLLALSVLAVLMSVVPAFIPF
jgi:rhomboid protease GluP